MRFGEKRKKVFQMLNAKPFIYDGIPLAPEDERSIELSYNRCPKCNSEMMVAHISSGREFWANLCGREGALSVCPQCGEFGEFKLIRMN